jgi:hypothetical protein
LNAVRASGIVLYFYRQEATLATTISASYLYILGVNDFFFPDLVSHLSIVPSGIL